MSYISFLNPLSNWFVFIPEWRLSPEGFFSLTVSHFSAAIKIDSHRGGFTTANIKRSLFCTTFFCITYVSFKDSALKRLQCHGDWQGKIDNANSQFIVFSIMYSHSYVWHTVRTCTPYVIHTHTYTTYVFIPFSIFTFYLLSTSFVV